MQDYVVILLYKDKVAAFLGETDGRGKPRRTVFTELRFFAAVGDKPAFCDAYCDTRRGKLRGALYVKTFVLTNVSIDTVVERLCSGFDSQGEKIFTPDKVGRRDVVSQDED